MLAVVVMVEGGGSEAAAAGPDIETAEFVGSIMLERISGKVAAALMLGKVDTSVLEEVEMAVLKTISEIEVASPVGAGLPKQEQAEARRCLLLFIRPKLSQPSAQRGAGAIRNLLGWLAQYRSACSWFLLKEQRQASWRHLRASSPDTIEERTSIATTL
jgi:hypothetical protein